METRTQDILEYGVAEYNVSQYIIPKEPSNEDNDLRREVY